MRPHHQFRHLRVTAFDRVDNMPMLHECTLAAFARHPELVAIQPHQVVQIIAQQLDHVRIVAALDYPVMEIQIAFALKIRMFRITLDLLAMLAQQFTQIGNFFIAHVLRRQPGGHAFQRLADVEDLDQLIAAERDHTCAHIGTPHDQATGLEPAYRLAQGSTADAVGTRQLGLADFAPRGDVALDDCFLDQRKDTIGDRTVLCPGRDTAGR